MAPLRLAPGAATRQAERRKGPGRVPDARYEPPAREAIAVHDAGGRPVRTAAQESSGLARSRQPLRRSPCAVHNATRRELGNQVSKTSPPVHGAWGAVLARTRWGVAMTRRTAVMGAIGAMLLTPVVACHRTPTEPGSEQRVERRASARLGDPAREARLDCHRRDDRVGLRPLTIPGVSGDGSRRRARSCPQARTRPRAPLSAERHPSAWIDRRDGPTRA